MSRFSRLRDSVRMSHEWPGRVGQAARRGDSFESLMRDVPGGRGFTSQIDSLTGNERFGNFMMWAVPRFIGAAIGGASGIGTGTGFGLGGMLDRTSETGVSQPPDSGSGFGTDGLLASLFMAGNRGQNQDQQTPTQPNRPFIGGEGLI